MYVYFFFSSRRRHTRLQGDWSSDVCSSDLGSVHSPPTFSSVYSGWPFLRTSMRVSFPGLRSFSRNSSVWLDPDRKSTRLNSSHLVISYAVFCLKKKKKKT